MRVHPLDTEPSQVRQDIGGKTSGIRHTPQCPSITHDPSLQGKYASLVWLLEDFYGFGFGGSIADAAPGHWESTRPGWIEL